MRLDDKSGTPFQGIENLSHTGIVLSLNVRLEQGSIQVEIVPTGESATISVPGDEAITMFYPSCEGDTIIVETRDGSRQKKLRLYDARTGHELTPTETRSRKISIYT